MKHHSTQPIYIFKRNNPQNSESPNGPRRGLDFIALNSGDGGVWNQWHLQGFQGLQGLNVPNPGGSTGIGLASMQLLERIRLQKIKITLRNRGVWNQWHLQGFEGLQVKD